MSIYLCRVPKLLFFIFFAWLTWLAQDHVFFWDTVQFAGKHGLWFYEQHFRQTWLPPEIDSGHPSGFGWYLAGMWMIFGKSLAVSHWAMLPFLWGIVWQLCRLGRLLLQHISPFWLLLVVVADPVFLGQSVLVSPDVVLLFFFLWALNSLLHQQTYALAIAYLGLTCISMRGMLVVAAFGLWELWQHWPLLKQGIRLSKLRWIFTFLPAGLFSLAFLTIHYYQSGWIGYHNDSPWAPSFATVGLSGILHNTVVFAWRWLDFGRVFVVLVFLALLARKVLLSYPRSRPMKNPIFPRSSPIVKVSGLLFTLTLLLSITFLSYQGLQAHRYLWPAFLTFNLLCLILVDQLPRRKPEKIFLMVLVFGLLSGNLWIYPERIAQGWDATLAHWPYYSLRGKMLDYLDEAAIPLHEVGTAFPDIGPLKFHDLSEDLIGFKEKDLQVDQWILYSNIMNDFSDAEIRELHENWIEQKRFQSWRIKMILYKKSF